MNKYFIAISEPGFDFSGNQLDKGNLYDTIVCHDGKFYHADRCVDHGMIYLLDKSKKEQAHKAEVSEISILKTIEKETFVSVVKRMRENQKAFFKSKPNTAERLEFLNKSKAYEKECDLLIKAMSDTQKKLF